VQRGDNARVWDVRRRDNAEARTIVP